MASLSSCTTSFPTTPEQLKPLVQVFSNPLVSPNCCSGKLNVKPKGNVSCTMFCCFMNAARQSAMWSNNCRRESTDVHTRHVRRPVGDAYLFTGTQHYVLRYGENSGLHFEVVLAQLYQQHPEVGAPQVQRQELAFLCNYNGRCV